MTIGKTLTHRADGTMKRPEELLETFFEQSSENGRAQLSAAIQVVTAEQISAAALELRGAIDRSSTATSRHERWLVAATVALAVATVVLARATVALALK